MDRHLHSLPPHLQTQLEGIRATDYPRYAHTHCVDLANTSSSGSSSTGSNSNILAIDNTSTAVDTTTADHSNALAIDTTEEMTTTTSNNNNNTTTYTTTATTTSSNIMTNCIEKNLIHSLYPYSSVLNPSSNITHKLSYYTQKNIYDAYYTDTTLYTIEYQYQAIIKIQIWLKANYIAKQYKKIFMNYIQEKEIIPSDLILSTQRKEYLLNILNSNTANGTTTSSNSDSSSRTNIFYKLLYILTSSLLYTKIRIKSHLIKNNKEFMQNIVEDCVEQALLYCIRNDNYELLYTQQRSATIVDTTDMNSIYNTTTTNNNIGNRNSMELLNPRSTDGKKTLSSRLFSGFSGNSPKNDSPNNSTSSMSYSANLINTTASTSISPISPIKNNNNSSKYDGSDSNNTNKSPVKSSLMGRLLGK